MRKFLSIAAALCLLAGCQCRQGSAPAPETDAIVETAPVDPVFTSEPVPAVVEARMRGVSYPDDAEIPLSDLRYLRLSYVDFEGHGQVGELVCNKAIAEDLLAIFRDLYAGSVRGPLSDPEHPAHRRFRRGRRGLDDG